MCSTTIINIFIIVIICCPMLNCMIHYNVCNDKGKYWTILWASGNYCGRLNLVIPIANRLLALKLKCIPWVCLEPIFESIANLYREYIIFCTEGNLPIGSITIMKQHITTSNLAIYKPRKDQCDTCTAYNAGNVDENEYQEHIKKKEEAKAERKRDNELAEKDDAVIVLYIDLQKVLLSPSLQTSACYCKSTQFT